MAYYGLLSEIPEEGIEIEGEAMTLPFSSAEPPYFRTESDGMITFLDWIAILDVTDDSDSVSQ